MRKIQTQGVHHITINGADRKTAIEFWEGVLGMPFVFEQPNLDNESESHLYFDFLIFFLMSKKKFWLPEKGAGYWFINIHGGAIADHDVRGENRDELFSARNMIGNIFQNRRDAQAVAKKINEIFRKRKPKK